MLPENLEGAILRPSLKIYDWVYLVVAAALIVRAFLVLSGSRVDRWAGIVAGAMGVSPSGGCPATQFAL